MKTYRVEVYSKSIRIDEWKCRSNRSPDAVALIDGERYQYFVSREGFVEAKSDWHGRGLNQLHYHANNSGTVVKWIPIGSRKSTRKKKQSPKQLEMFPTAVTYQ